MMEQEEQQEQEQEQQEQQHGTQQRPCRFSEATRQCHPKSLWRINELRIAMRKVSANTYKTSVF